MTLSEEDRDSLIGLLKGLSEAQLSTLVAAIGEPESQIGTSTDSANYAFLKKLCDLGVAEEVPLKVELPADRQAALRAVRIRESAKTEIASLLVHLNRGTGQGS